MPWMPDDLRVRDQRHRPLAGHELAELLERAEGDVDARRGEDDVIQRAGDGVGGIAVERPPLLVERPERPFLLRQGPPLAADALPGDVRLDLDVHGQGVVAEGFADLRARHRAAAERDHRRRPRPERLQRGLLLAHAELDLAALLEDLGDGLAQAALDLAVEVDEPPAQPLRELQPERRLAGAHESDEREMPV